MKSLNTSVLLGCLVIILTSMQSTFSLDELTGKVMWSTTNPGGMHDSTAAAFHDMQQAAAQDGIQLSIASGFRNYDRQMSIWNRKYKRYRNQGLLQEAAARKVIEYSTIPGTSRHHWGTDLDLIDASKRVAGDHLRASNYENDGPYCPLYEWMQEHAADYGFYLVYTADPERKGFKYEPWHWSYAPRSIPMLAAYQESVDLKQLISDAIGDDLSITDDFITEYFNGNILDINPVLLPQ